MLTNIQNLLLEVLMQYSCILSHELSPIERRFHDIRIVIIKKSVVSHVGIKRVDCIVVVAVFSFVCCRT